MYISFLDFLKEVKSKFYIIIIFGIIFLSISYSFNHYKSKDNIFSARINLVKLSTTNMYQGKKMEYNMQSAIEWISSNAVSNYNYNKENLKMNLKCESEDYLIICTTSGEVDSKDLEKQIKDLILTSINSALDEYETYYTSIFDEIITIDTNIKDFVDNAQDATVFEMAHQRHILEQGKLSKSIFSKAIAGSKLTGADISSQPFKVNVRYGLVILTAIVCGLFVIFLQMKDKK